MRRTLKEIDTSNFRFVWLIVTLMIIDFLATLAAGLVFQNQSYSLIIILCIILSDIIVVVTLFFRFTYTYPFQAGMVKLMYDDLTTEWIFGIAFLVACIGFRGQQILKIMSCNGCSLPNLPADQILTVLYRILNMLFYYYMQRASLKLCDLKYYHDSVWFKEKSLQASMK